MIVDYGEITKRISDIKTKNGEVYNMGDNSNLNLLISSIYKQLGTTEKTGEDITIIDNDKADILIKKAINNDKSDINTLNDADDSEFIKCKDNMTEYIIDQYGKYISEYKRGREGVNRLRISMPTIPKSLDGIESFAYCKYSYYKNEFGVIVYYCIDSIWYVDVARYEEYINTHMLKIRTSQNFDEELQLIMSYTTDDLVNIYICKRKSLHDKLDIINYVIKIDDIIVEVPEYVKHNVYKTFIKIVGNKIYFKDVMYDIDENKWKYNLKSKLFYLLYFKLRLIKI